VFLAETRLHKDRVGNIKSRIGMNKSFVVDGQGKSGGLALFWEDSLKISILSYDLHHVDTLIWDGEHHVAWRGTFMYGEACIHERLRMWELLRRIKPCQKALWMVIGDFNEVMWHFEHFSNRQQPAKQILDFREVLSHCDLHDIGFIGLPWTYNDNQKGERNVRVRLDRVVGSSSWSDWFRCSTLYPHVRTTARYS
jgi:hypothetical protein